MNIYKSLTAATLVIAILASATTSPITYGARSCFAGWHLGVTTASTFLLVKELAPQKTYALETLYLFVISTQLLNALFLLVHGAGAGLKPEESHDLSLVFLWVSVFVVGVQALLS